MKNTLIVSLFSIINLSTIQAQVGVGTTNPHSSAILDVNASNKGFLLPRLSITGKADNATVSSPANGLIVYNQNAAGTGNNVVVANSLYFRQNSSWEKFGSVTEIGALAFGGQFVLQTTTQQPFSGNNLNNINGSSGTTADIPVTWDSSNDVFLDNTNDIQLTANGLNFRINTAGQYRILANFSFDPKRNENGDNTNFSAVSFTIMKSSNGNTGPWTPVGGSTMPYDNATTNGVQTIIIPRTILSFAQNDLIRIVMSKPIAGQNYGAGSGIVSKTSNDITKLVRIRKIN